MKMKNLDLVGLVASVVALGAGVVKGVVSERKQDEHIKQLINDEIDARESSIDEIDDSEETE